MLGEIIIGMFSGTITAVGVGLSIAIMKDARGEGVIGYLFAAVVFVLSLAIALIGVAGILEGRGIVI